MSKDKNPRITSPAAPCEYPRLNKPDTKFNPEGVYDVTLIFDEAEPKHAEFLARIRKFEAGAVESARADNPKLAKAKIKLADSPLRPVLDDEGNEVPGKFKLRFKMRASGERKDKSVWTMRPALFDAKGKPLSPDTKVGGGSILKVSFEPGHFYTASLGAGARFRLEAVQVLELKEYTGGREASAYGFGEEEGYVASEEGADSGNADAEAPDSAAQPEGSADAPAADTPPRKRGDF